MTTQTWQEIATDTLQAVHEWLELDDVYEAHTALLNCFTYHRRMVCDGEKGSSILLEHISAARHRLELADMARYARKRYEASVSVDRPIRAGIVVSECV